MGEVINLADEKGVGFVISRSIEYASKESPDKAMMIFWHDANEENPDLVTFFYGGASPLELIGILEHAKIAIMEE